MTSLPEPTVSDADEARRARIRESLALNRIQVQRAEEGLDDARNKRRELMLLALEGAEKGENLFSYSEITEMTGLARSSILKAVGEKRRERVAAAGDGD